MRECFHHRPFRQLMTLMQTLRSRVGLVAILGWSYVVLDNNTISCFATGQCESSDESQREVGERFVQEDLEAGSAGELYRETKSENSKCRSLVSHGKTLVEVIFRSLILNL